MYFFFFGHCYWTISRYSLNGNAFLFQWIVVSDRNRYVEYSSILLMRFYYFFLYLLQIDLIKTMPMIEKWLTFSHNAFDAGFF